MEEQSNGKKYNLAKDFAKTLAEIHNFWSGLAE